MVNLQSVNTVGIFVPVKGNDLKSFREKYNFTQESLAKVLGVSTNTVARWERDERKIPEYLNLALKTIERELKSPQ